MCLLNCRRLLREEFTSGRLDAAPSKAEVLGQLCDRLNFDDEAAAQLHKQLYREKLTSIVEKKNITGDFLHACTDGTRLYVVVATNYTSRWLVLGRHACYIKKKLITGERSACTQG